MKTPTIFILMCLFTLALESVHAVPKPDSNYVSAAAASESSYDAYVLEMVQPRYPMLMRERGIQGHVLLKVFVTETGQIAASRVVTASQPEFAEATQKAVKEWLFEPGHRDGVAVPQTVLVPVSFIIEDGRSASRQTIASL